MLHVLLTNDDGIHAEGIQALRRALAAIEDIRLAVIAPDENQSATARSITTRRPLWVTEVPFEDGTHGFSCDGTPVDCVRLASLGLIDGFQPDLIVSGINHGSNLGDDITYSGTVAAALEGVVLGVPGIAVSQQSLAGEMDFRPGERFDFAAAAAFAARMVEQLDDVPLPEGTLLNVNVPAGEPEGVEVARLGKRVYRDELRVVEDVVAVPVVGQLPAELGGASLEFRRAHSAISSAAGSSSAARSKARSASSPCAAVRSKCSGVTATRPAETAARSVPSSSSWTGESP